jgi:hypothetical protein
MLTTPDGRGAVNILAADRLMSSPRLYATFLLWLLAELFEELPEVGDLDKPKLVFFFDEAHLLFKDAPKALIEKVEQVVRLIRSKGVGVYFITQNPLDVPSTVLAQLGNRVQHALRAFTPAEQKAVRAAAETFRPNPRFETRDAITELGVGEALVSTLQPGGVPGVVDRVMVCPPRSRLGPVTPEERAATTGLSPVGPKYDEPLERESAYELLQGRATTVADDVAPHSPWGTSAAPPRHDVGNPGASSRPPRRGRDLAPRLVPRRRTPGLRPDLVAPPRRPARPARSTRAGRRAPGGLLGDVLTGGGGRRQGVAEALAKSVVRSVGSSVGRQVGTSIVRGVLGSILKR